MKTTRYCPLLILIPILGLLATNCVFAQAKPVTTTNIERMTFFPKQSVSANVLSNHHALIRAQTSGELKTIHAQIGSKVKKGQSLAHLACDDQNLALEHIESVLPGTQAKHDLSVWQLKQYQTLADKNNLSKERMKTLESELLFQKSMLKQHQNQHATARLQVERCDIKAPFDGIVTAREGQLGEYVQVGAPLFKVIANEDLEVQVFLHPEQIPLLPKAKQIVFKDDDQVYPVKIRAQVESLDDRTHTQEVRLVFTKNKPLPGSLGTLQWKDVRPHIPAALLSKRNNQLGIFINNEDKAIFLPLNQAKEGSPVALPPSLTGNIIVDGRHQLEDGSPLSVTDVEGNSNEVA